MAIKALSQRIPTLRLYQQIILYVIAVIFIPLLVVHGLIYSINQKALKKELVKFTEHTAEIIYTDVSAQLNGQAEQTRLLSGLVKEPLENGIPFEQAALRVFQAAPQTLRLSLYDKTGQLLANVDNRSLNQRALEYEMTSPPQHLITEEHLNNHVDTRDKAEKKSEISRDNIQFHLHYQPKRPSTLNTKKNTAPNNNSNTASEQKSSTDLQQSKTSPYILASTINLTTQKSFRINGTNKQVAYYRFEKTFAYLDTLIERQNWKLNEGFYLIDQSGHMLAGPTRLMQNISSSQNTETPRTLPQLTPLSQINLEQLGQQLAHMSPGRANIVSEFKRPFWQQTIESLEPLVDFLKQPIIWLFGKEPQDGEQNEEDATPIEKVVIKLPMTDWGIIIESPYSVRQKYVKRARNQSLLIIFLQLLVAILVTVFYITNLRRNFRQLIKGIQAVAEGKYSRRIRLIANWLTPFEIMYLTSEFNRMSRRRAEAWNESEALNQQLTTANIKLAQLDNMKSNLIDTVSHELRTPLTSIKGYTSRLIRYDDTLDKDMRLKSLKVIKRQADRLNRLVDDLLVIPELEQQHLHVDLEPVLLHPLLTRSIQSVAEKEREQLPEIQIQYPTDAEPDHVFVLGDEDRLEQVIINLLDNAVKYAEPNTPISVSISKQEESDEPHSQNKQWLIAVQNTCPPDGLPDSTEAAQQLFEKFKRMDESTTRTTRGTGLGLYITKGLVEAMNGTIDVHVNQSCFTIQVSLPSASPAVQKA